MFSLFLPSRSRSVGGCCSPGCKAATTHSTAVDYGRPEDVRQACTKRAMVRATSPKERKINTLLAVRYLEGRAQRTRVCGYGQPSLIHFTQSFVVFVVVVFVYQLKFRLLVRRCILVDIRVTLLLRCCFWWWNPTTTREQVVSPHDPQSPRTKHNRATIY